MNAVERALRAPWPRAQEACPVALVGGLGAEAAIDLILQRGFSRGRDLRTGLAEIRALADR